MAIAELDIVPHTTTNPTERYSPLQQRPVYSVVAPVYNEQELVAEFCRRVVATMEQLQEPFEIVLINDGSRDRSPEIMRDLNAADPRIKVINFSRNFGHQLAMTAGMDYASGDAVVVIDSDLQDPPEVIPSLIEQWKQGYQVVFAVRSEREGETAFKRLTASMFYRLIRRITNVEEAVCYLGFTMVRNLALTIGVFNASEQPAGFSFEALQQQALRVASLSLSLIHI